MKKRFWIAAISMVWFLSGCTAQNTWETVKDVLPEEAVSVMEDAYRVWLDVPDDALLALASDDGTQMVYEQTEGEYEITVQTFLSSEPESVMRRLTGFEPEQVQTLQTRRFGLPEYQFAWFTTGADGGWLCRADLLQDDVYCYAVTFSVREGIGAKYAETAQQVFQSIAMNASVEL